MATQVDTSAVEARRQLELRERGEAIQALTPEEVVLGGHLRHSLNESGVYLSTPNVPWEAVPSYLMPDQRAAFVLDALVAIAVKRARPLPDHPE